MNWIAPSVQGRRSRRAVQPAAEVEAGGLACRDCGILVTDPDAEVEVLEAEQKEVQLAARGGQAGPVVTREQRAETRMTSCPVCRERAETAARLIERHPSLLAYIRHAQTRIDVANAALMVLDALGVEWRAIEFEQVLTKRLALVFKRLPSVAHDLPWSSNFAPVLRAGFEPGNYSGKVDRWNHLTSAQRVPLTEVYGRILQDAIDGPRSVAPPSGEDGRAADVSGCLLCGIGTITVLASDVSTAWGALTKAETRAVGGKRRPQPVHGYLCPRCRGVVDKLGGIGMTAVENSICDYLGITRNAFDRIEALRESEGLRIALGSPTATSIPTPPAAWCTLPPGSPTNSRPWQHLGDLTELREGLTAL